jgi:adenylate kinase family enzyme
VRVHILGASGSGTTTLAAALSTRLGCAHFDTDDFFWLPTQPKFLEIRPVEERTTMLTGALDQARRWVLSGSLCGWGDVFIPRFELVVFMYIPPEIRMARLAQREADRYGAAAIASGGADRAKYETFMTWAAAYDTGDVSRTLAIHERWLTTLPCPVLRLTTAAPLADHLNQLLARLAS